MTAKRLIISVLLVLCLALLPLFVKEDYFINLILLVGIYTILSQSWNIFGGYCGQISLGHAAFFGMGALASRYCWVSGYPYIIVLLAGGISSLILACMVLIPSLKLKDHYFAICTLALAMIGLITVQNTLPGVDFLPPDLVANYSLLTRYYMVLLIGVATIITVYFLENSRLGLGMISIREDEDAAEAIGIGIFKHKVISMAISTFIAGVAGGLFSIYSVSFYYYVPFELWWSFDPLLITFIGGSGTVLGPIIGAVCYVILKEIFAISLGQANVVIFGAVFIIIVLFLPKGLVGLMGKLHRA